MSMCPVRLIPKLFSFDDEEIPANLRAQRTLNKARVPDIARYITSNLDSYTFSAITVSINGEIDFEPGAAEDIGTLKISMDSRFVINDGQHRQAAFETALKEVPELGDETIAVVFFLDVGLKRSQQMFTDLNRYAARPDASLNILYDYRDKKSILSKAVVKQVEMFDRLTDSERSNLPVRSSKLFTLSAIYRATQALLSDHRNEELEDQVELASHFWNTVSDNMPDWQQVLQRNVSAGEIRREYIHSHAIGLTGIGTAGAALLSFYPDNWKSHLKKIRKVDWSRSNPYWEGRIMSDGRISKARTSIMFMTAHLKSVMGLPTSSEEDALERAFALIDR